MSPRVAGRPITGWPRQKLHASYLVLATFHSRLGYARPWPSTITGSCATQRDFLGELVAAGKARGLEVILYMTDDPQWHNEQGVETVTGPSFNVVTSTTITVPLKAGVNTIRFHNDTANAPDLDRITLA